MTDSSNIDSSSCSYSVDPGKAADARWDEASKVTIKVLTKPCPKCRTPTERDGKLIQIWDYDCGTTLTLFSQ